MSFIQKAIAPVALAATAILAPQVSNAATAEQLRQDPRWEEVSPDVFVAELPNGIRMTHMFGVNGLRAALADLKGKANSMVSGKSMKEQEDVQHQIAEIQDMLKEATAPRAKGHPPKYAYTCGVNWSLATNHRVENFAYYGVTATGNFNPGAAGGQGGMMSTSVLSSITSTSGNTYTDRDFKWSFGVPNYSYTLNAYMSVPTWTGSWYSSASLRIKTPGCSDYQVLMHEGTI